MVNYTDVLKNNNSLQQPNLTAVFVGGTNGIGLGALRAFTKHAESPTIYIVGRSQSNLNSLTTSLSTTNKSAKLIPIQVNDLTLVKDASKAASQIAATAPQIDLLVMSPGYLSLRRDESPEGLDRVQAIRFYARMRFVLTLLPLLRKAPAPRVVSVLAGGMEGRLFPDDLLLKDHYSLPAAGDAASSMMTLFLEELARRPGNERVSFVHIYPGIVGGTGLGIKDLGPWATWLLNWTIVPLMRLVGYTMEEAGERVVFAATSDRFKRIAEGENDESGQVQKGSDGKVGSGVYLVQGDSRAVTEGKVLKALKAEGMGQKVYQHTLDELERIEKL